MAAVAVFKLDRKGIQQIAMSPPARTAVRQVVEGRAKPYAEAISPVDSGEYKSSFHVVDATVYLHRRWRAACLLLNTAAHAAAVEWGNRATRGKAHRVLQRTVAHLNGYQRRQM